MKKIVENQSGISLLLAVIIISAVSLLVATTSTLLIIDENKNEIHHSQSLKTFNAANSCLDEALLALAGNSSYTGESLTISGVSCTITVSGSGGTRTVDVSAVLNSEYTRKLQAAVSITPSVTITSWQEINS